MGMDRNLRLIAAIVTKIARIIPTIDMLVDFSDYVVWVCLERVSDSLQNDYLSAYAPELDSAKMRAPERRPDSQ